MKEPVKLFASLLAPTRARWGILEGESLRLPGRIVEHEPPKVHPVRFEPSLLRLSGPSWPSRLWPTCSGGLLHSYYHSGPKAEWRELSTCKCAHEQPYCHLILSEGGLGMHLPVTSLNLQGPWSVHALISLSDLKEAVIERTWIPEICQAQHSEPLRSCRVCREWGEWEGVQHNWLCCTVCMRAGEKGVLLSFLIAPLGSPWASRQLID